MNDELLLRYSRHILLGEFGIAGQERLNCASALIVGLGGLGSPAALYLASSGVGRIVLVDHDRVDATNLQRQVAHTLARVGQPKVESAAAAMWAINPDITIQCHAVRAEGAMLARLIREADVVLDCCDNFDTRYQINRLCHELKTPLVSGAAIQFDGQISVFDFRRHASPCYHCLFPADATAAELRCATTGVFAPLVGVIGSLQAAEALKLLAAMPGVQHARLLALNLIDMRIMQSRISADPACPVCGISHTASFSTTTD